MSLVITKRGFSYKTHTSNLLHSNGLGLKYGFIDLDHVTHYLKFSIKINTNQLNGHFSQKVPYLEKEVSEFVLEGVGN